MKKQMIFIVLFMLIFFNTAYANEHIEGILNSKAYENLNNLSNQSENINKVYENFSFLDFVKNITDAKNVFDAKSVLSKIGKIFFGQIHKNIPVLITLIVLSILSMLIENINSSFNSKSTSEIAFFAFYLLYTGILSAGFFSCYESAKKVIGEQSAFMQAATPTYISMLVMTGNVATGSVIKPLFLYFISTVTVIIEKILLPLTVMIFIMSTVNNLSKKVEITRLINLLSLAVKKTLLIMTTLFIAMISLAKLSSMAIDGFGIRMAKYAVGNFVPVVGGILTGTLDTVLSSFVILKNALGCAMVVVIALICAHPVIEFIALIFIYKLASGIVEVFGEKRVSDALFFASESISLIFTMILCISIMFILGTAILIQFAKGSV